MGVRAVMNLTPGECSYHPLRALISDGSCDANPTNHHAEEGHKAVLNFVANAIFQQRHTKQVALTNYFTLLCNLYRFLETWKLVDASFFITASIIHSHEDGVHELNTQCNYRFSHAIQMLC